MDVFYSQNTFELSTWHCQNGNIAHPSTKRDDLHIVNLGLVGMFLQKLSPRTLPLIRRLQIRLPPIDVDCLVDDRWDWEAWEKGCAQLARTLTLPRLRLELHFEDHGRITREELQRRLDDSASDRKAMLAVYGHVMRPLVALSLADLASLSIYLSYPYGNKRAVERQGLEADLERMVMGDKYDAYKHGKQRPLPGRRPFVGEDEW